MKALAKCSFSLTSKTISITWHKSEAASNPKPSAEPEKPTKEIPSDIAAESTEEVKSETVQSSTAEATTTTTTETVESSIAEATANTTTETVEGTTTATEATTERDPVDALFDSSGNSSGNAENLVPESIASES